MCIDPPIAISPEWKRALLALTLDLFTANVPLNHADPQSAPENFDWASCLERVEARDESAATDLVNELYPRISRIVGRRGSTQLAVEDVVQEVFVRIFEKLNQFRGDVPFEHWASKVAVNVSLNHLRGKRLKLELRRADLSDEEDAALDEVSSDSSAPNPMHAVAANDLLLKLMDGLNPDDRMAVELIELQGHTTEEAANLMRIRPAAMRARISRARKKLKVHLNTLTQETKIP